MGIEGLLKQLKKCTQERNLEQYRGQRAAVDTYAWLHKIIKSSTGRQIIIGKDQKRYVHECIKKIEKIQKVDIKLTMVFDGGVLPRKMKQEQTRKRRREQNFNKGKELIDSGNPDQGYKKMVDSIDISPDVAYLLIEQLKARNIDFIVAPYEADAQLAYLSRNDIVDFIITEDSDLLAFGAKKVLYKLDFGSLNGQQICLQSIKNEPEAGFPWFTHNMFLATCIMAGCDYLDQVKGVGMKVAQKLVSKNITVRKSIAQLSQTKQIPENYQDNFMKALLTFRFQRVYCPIRKSCVSVNQMLPKLWRRIKQIPKTTQWVDEIFDAQMLQYALRLSSDQTSMEWQFLGKVLSDETAQKIAEGIINPVTFAGYDKNCLNQLRYDQQITTFHSKKSATTTISVKQTQQGILKYCKNVEKKNPLAYRSIKSKVINGDDYRIYNRDENVTSKCFPITQIGKNDKKKQLRFHNDSDEENDQQQSVISLNQSVQLISSSQSPIIGSSCEQIKSVKTLKSKQDWSNQLERMSQQMFGKIFSDQFLQSPFSC